MSYSWRTVDYSSKELQPIQLTILFIFWWLFFDYFRMRFIQRPKLHITVTYYLYTSYILFVLYHIVLQGINYKQYSCAPGND